MWVLGLRGLTKYFLRLTAVFDQVNSIIMWNFPGFTILTVTPAFIPL